MLKRYPHSATIKIATEGTSSDGISNTVTYQNIEINCRYEPKGANKQLNYSGALYCTKLDILKTNPKALNGQKVEIFGDSIGISEAFNYQTHCEIWLD